MVLFLFSMGVTKGKWGTLINGLLEFKRDYDANTPLDQVMPKVVAAGPARYAGMGVKDLGDQMWAKLRESRMGLLGGRGLRPPAGPGDAAAAAFQKLMAGEAELVPLDALANRVVTVGVIPYRPGSPSSCRARTSARRTAPG
jgi:arginine decarboxylase